MIISGFAALRSLVSAILFLNRIKTVALAVAALFLLLPGVAAASGNDFGSVAVGTTAGPKTITVVGTVGTTVDTVDVVTLGVVASGSVTTDYTRASGGTCVSGFAFTAGAASCTVNVDFAPHFPGQRNGAVTVLGGGVLLGSTAITGTGTSPQIAFSPGTLGTVQSASGFQVLGGVLDGTGNAYVTVVGGFGVYFAQPAGVFNSASLFAGTGNPGFADGPSGSAQFNNPTGIAIDGAGNLYVSDTGNNAIRKVSNGQVTTIAGGPNAGTALGDGGPAVNANVSSPTAIGVDAAGNVFFDDSGHARLRKIDAVTGTISTVAGNGTQGFGGDGGPGTAPGAEIGLSNGIAINAAGDIFFSDSTNDIIRELDAAGTLHTIAGKAGVTGNTGDGGPATEALLNDPMGVALDASGAIYFTDSKNFVVRRIDADGKITTVAGTIGASFAGADGDPSTATGLELPTALVVDSSGNLLIEDFKNSTVRTVTVSAVPTVNFPGTQFTQRQSAPQSVTIYNTGNAPLNLGINVQALDFAVASTSTCAPGTPVAPGLSCRLDIVADPLPSSVGIISGAVQITSDSLNGSASTTINLTAAVILGPVQLAISPPSVPIIAGGNLGLITVAELDGNFNLVPSATDTIMLTVIGPHGFSLTQTATAVGGTAFFDLSGQALTAAGAYVITATAVGVTPPLVAQPFGFSVVAGTTAKVIASAVPATLASGQAVGNVTITTEDQFGNVSAFNGPATVTVIGPTGPGSVTATYNGTLTNGMGTIAASGALNAAGTYLVVATAGGFSSTAQIVTVSATATNFTTTPIPTALPLGGNLGVIKATIRDASGNIVATSTAAVTVSITGPGGFTSSTTVNAVAGVATINLTGVALNTAGNHTVTVPSAGLTGPAPTVVVVAQAATVTTLTSSGSPSAQGAQVTFTATVTGASGGTPTGTVTFFDGTTELGTGQLAGGTATLQTTFNTVGPHSITAVYGGDANFTGSTSAAFVQSVTAAFTLSLDPSSLNLSRGQTGFVALTVTAGSGFSGQVNLSCSNLPAHMDCIFNPSLAVVNGNSQVVELVLKTRGNFPTPTASIKSPGGSDAPMFPALAFWMPGAALSAFGLRRKNMNRRKRQALLLIVLMLGMGGLIGLAGCGSGDGPEAPAGTYNINVNGTSGTLVNSAALTVIIK